jgi:hypothetical protein
VVAIILMEGTYRAVAGHHMETTESGHEYEVNEVVFNGEPIPHVPYTSSSADDLTWGYGGAGPANTSRSILEHAIDIAENRPNVDPAEVRKDFRGIEAYTEPETNESGDIITHDEVMEFLRQKEREAEGREKL